MKNIEQIVKARLIELKSNGVKVTQRKICKEIGIQPSALQKIFRENSTGIRTLEKIAKAIDVQLSTFFEEGENPYLLEEEAPEYIRVKTVDYIKLLETANTNLNKKIEEKELELERLKNIEKA